MPSETADVRRQVRPQQPTMQTTSQAAAAAAAPPKPTESLPCPRCGSSSTKFCYYNNYNLSQPRYFCKGCRRYWTQGGTLRNVPVGGGTRKNSASASKRSRSSSVSASSSSTNSSSNSATSTSTITTTPTTAAAAAPTIPTTTTTNTTATATHEPESLPVPVSASGSDVHPENLSGVKLESQYDLNLNEKFQPVMTDSGNFMSLLNSQEPGLPMGMNGYGSGFGYGFFEMGLGFGGRGGGGGGGWVYPGIGNVGDGAGADNSGCNTWQQQLGHDVVEGNVNGNGNGNGLVDSDYFAWPGLAISAPGKSLK